MKKVLSVLAGAVLLFAGTSFVLASPVPGDIQITQLDGDGTTLDSIYLPTRQASTTALMGSDIFNNPQWIYPLDFPFGCLKTIGSFGTDLTNGSLIVDTECVGNNLLLSNLADGPTWVSAINSKISTSTFNSTINGLNNAITTLSVPFNVTGFMANQASTTLLVATSTFNGFMSGAMVTKLAALSTSTRSMATSTRSIVTGTGATGFQVSSTRDSEVRYSTTIVTTSNIAGSQNGTVVLEIAPTNSATAGDWSEIGRCTNGTSYTLAIAIQGVSTQACQITGYVPTGYFAKIRSINNAGTPTFSFNSAQEVLQ